MGRSRSVLFQLGWWNLAEGLALAVLPCCSWDCCLPCELVSAREPAGLPTPEAAYVVTWAICCRAWWRKGGTSMRGPLLCSVLRICLYIMLMTLDPSSSCHSRRMCWDDLSAGGLHKGGEIWEAVQRSARMLMHRGQLRGKQSALKT